MIYPRLGYDVVIPDSLTDRVQLVDAPIIEVSSTLVRQLVNEGMSARFYVPDDVEQYITRKHLYQNND